MALTAGSPGSLLGQLCKASPGGALRAASVGPGHRPADKPHTSGQWSMQGNLHPAA